MSARAKDAAGRAADEVKEAGAAALHEVKQAGQGSMAGVDAPVTVVDDSYLAAE